jgi:Carboxypeptidase regulatory-like domain
MKRLVNLSRFCLSICTVTILTLGLAIHSCAQSAGTAEIRGTITDPARAVVPDAAVVVRNVETGAERTLTTNADGIYLAPLLQPGRYEVTVTKQGLATVKHENLNLEVGQILVVDLSLPLKTTQESVTVTGEAGLVETEKFDVSQTISHEYVENLPLNGRRWDNFVLLTPGASEDGGFGGVSFRGVSSLYNNNTVDGADNNQAFFSEARGRTRLPYGYSLDAIKEFNVTSAAYTAEYGRAAGGVVNAITRSGTSELHGDFFYFIRDAAFLAEDPVAKGSGQPKPPERRQQFGGSLGGPLFKDKLFYFATYDQQKHTFPAIILPFSSNFFDATDPRSQVSNCKDPNCAVVIANLKAITNVTMPREGSNYLGFAKVDYQINPNHHLSAALNILRWDSLNGIEASGATLTTTPLGQGSDNVSNEFSTTTWNWIINPRLVNEARFQYGRDFESETPNASGPSIRISGAADFGMATFLPRAKYPDEKRYQWVDNLSWVRGRHQIKVGVDINYVRELLINLFEGGGFYDYFNTGRGATFNGALNHFAHDLANGTSSYGFFAQAVDPVNGSGGGSFTTTDHNFYVQDNVQVRSNLTLNLGLRYELQTMPSVQKAFPSVPETAKFNTDKNNFGPRIGFAWGIGGGQKQVLRGGYGIYYGRTSNSSIFAALFQNGVFQQTFNFGNSDCGAPTPPDIVFPQPLGSPNFTPIFGTSGGPTPKSEFTSLAGLLAVCPNAAASGLVVTAMDSHFVNPLVHQFDLAYERELPGNMSFTVSYVGSRGLRLPTFVDANLPPPDTTATYQLQDASGNNVKTFTVPFFSGAVQRPNQNVGVVLMGKSVINSWYHSLVLRLRRKMTHGFSFDTNFTWSQARDNGQTPGSQGTFAGTDTPLNPFDVKSEYGLSDLDIRRRFVFTTYWEMPFGNWTQNDTMKRVVGGWKLSSVWRVQDGRPVTAFMDSFPNCNLDGGLTCGLVNNFGGADVGRAPFLARNSQFTSPGLFTTDLRIGREFKVTERARLELLWEAFNLFNRTNVTGVDNDAFDFTAFDPTNPAACPVPAGATNFQGCVSPHSTFLNTQSTSNTLYGARQMQFGAKIRF